MSVIDFRCSLEESEKIKEKVWNIVKEHYINTAFPNTRVEYEREDEEVYLERLNELMKTELCLFTKTEEGIRFEFDLSEDAGISIAEKVYGTGMGYCDEGLSYIDDILDTIVEALPEICFEGYTDFDDDWSDKSFTYDGENLSYDEDYDE